MKHFHYHSNCQPNSLRVWMLSDFEPVSPRPKGKQAVQRYMREIEKTLAEKIETFLTNGGTPVRYYIFGNQHLIATTNLYDNASLLAEALAAHSPYYQCIDVMSYEGLQFHLLSKDFLNDHCNRLLDLERTPVIRQSQTDVFSYGVKAGAKAARESQAYQMGIAMLKDGIPAEAVVRYTKLPWEQAETLAKVFHPKRSKRTSC